MSTFDLCSTYSSRFPMALSSQRHLLPLLEKVSTDSTSRWLSLLRDYLCCLVRSCSSMRSTFSYNFLSDPSS